MGLLVLRGRDAEAVLVDIAGLIWENDHFGYEHGDATIRTVAGLFSQAAEKYGASLYRFGGRNSSFFSLTSRTRTRSVSLIPSSRDIQGPA